MRRTALAVIVLALAAHGASSPASGDELDPGFTQPSAPSVPPGLYLVTDVYAGDVVTTSGDTTTYTTVTVNESPGTYARIIDVVGTGAASVFDGRSFNGRARLTDGRLVTGAYYETFVRTSDGFAPVSIVFFQDDSETGSRTAPTPTPPPTTPVGPPAARPSVAPASAGPSPMGPEPEPTSGPVRPAPSAAPGRPTARPVVARAAISLAASGPTLGSIEVLRGRVVRLWPRAFVDGVVVPVREWRLVEGTIDEAPRHSGGALEACDATWLAVPGPDTTLVLRFEVTTDAAPGRVLTATIAVTVRSPALLQ